MKIISSRTINTIALLHLEINKNNFQSGSAFKKILFHVFLNATMIAENIHGG
jgi:hypothetical protein